jgi:hypothetical protein
MTPRMIAIMHEFSAKRVLYQSDICIWHCLEPYQRTFSSYLTSAVRFGLWRLIGALLMLCVQQGISTDIQVSRLGRINKCVSRCLLVARRQRCAYLLFMLFAMIGIAPAAGADRRQIPNMTSPAHYNTNVRSIPHTPAMSTPSNLSAERMRQLSRLRLNLDRDENRRRRINGVMGSGGTGTRPVLINTDSPSAVPVPVLHEPSEILPRSLDDIFAECRNNPNWLPPDDEMTRMADATRQRESREYRQARAAHFRIREQDGMQSSFNTPAVPSVDTLHRLAETDPDAALLLFHETGGMWRFSTTDPIGPTSDCPADISSALDQEMCSPAVQTELINKYQQPSSDSKPDEDDIDPRWSALKNLN